MRTRPGSPSPLGATWDGEGVNFALFSHHATAVELCLFDDTGEEARIPLRERTDDVWHAYLQDARPGQRYGYRVHGPYAPEDGHRFNPHKLLLDPYAKVLTGEVAWSDALFGYPVGDTEEDLVIDTRESAGSMPKSMVVDTSFTWGGDRPPRTPWHRTVIYECHVRGLTMRHPGVPEQLRGTYLGLAAEPVLDHLRSLGVTAVELLPVHHSVSEQALVDRGLTNYWGYNSIGFFAPHRAYATDGGDPVTEFKSMVKALHRAGIEVILDVVYNHTAEGGHLGPTLSFRGIDNAVYYRLDPGDPRYTWDVTGTGNTVNMAEHHPVQLVMDSLRYWAEEMHVDGFRFDLATALARDEKGVGWTGPFISACRQDPVLAGTKLIAEPWDLGAGGYQLGGFPPAWAEWNDRYRDSVRRFWRGDTGQLPELASRLTGSADIFAATGRRTYASINYVTAHDGFTLHDLVSYERKRNEANGEDNRDGPETEHSRNWGQEGPAGSPRVRRMRERMKRNLLSTLLLSQGVPMLVAGDEMGRTQLGNNNAYCQDNEVSWVRWDLEPEDRDLLRFTRRVLELFRSTPVLRRRGFFSGRADGDAKDLTWVRPDGEEMTRKDWDDRERQVIGMLVQGRAADETDERGRPIVGDTMLLLMNGGWRSRRFVLPTVPGGPGLWSEVLNTAQPGSARVLRKVALNLQAHSLMLLRFAERA
ncbi:MAG TPA: glycogen debranching protein GlgX [Actinomycetota bacterium]